MQSTAFYLSVLMDNYKVLLYNGQLDFIVGGPLTEKFLQVLKWSGQEDYLKADRTVWRIGDEVAGYVRQVGKFMQVRTFESVLHIPLAIVASLSLLLISLSPLPPSLQVIVLGSGHILPYDQPERGLNLIQTFINMTG